jgi:hypothetical protein
MNAPSQSSFLGPNIKPNKASITSKPFVRPFSEANPGKRQGPKIYLNTDFDQR